jgi:hypothetical protein
VESSGGSAIVAAGGQVGATTGELYGLSVDGPSPASVLVFSIETGAVVAASPVASPVSVDAPALLISADGVRFDSRRGTIFVARVEIPAGVSLGKQRFTGPVGVSVESGAVSVVGAASTDLLLPVGGNFVIPGLTSVDLINDADQPAVLLAAGVLAPVTGNANGPTPTPTEGVDRLATAEAENAQLQSNLILMGTSEANAYATVEAQSTAVASAEAALASAEAELTAAESAAGDAATAQANAEAALATSEADLAAAEATLTAVNGALATAEAEAASAAEDASAASEASASEASSLEATITALQTESAAQTTAAANADATIAAQATAIADANSAATAAANAQATADAAAAGDLANAEATSAAYATAIVDLEATAMADAAAAEAAQNEQATAAADAVANAEATASAELANAQATASAGAATVAAAARAEAANAAATITSLTESSSAAADAASADAAAAEATIAALNVSADGLEGSLATAIADGVSAQATVSALSTAVADSANLAVASVNPEYVDVSVQVDWTGVINGDAAAIAAAEEALRTALAPYATCRAGVVLTFGHGSTIGEGTVLARAINTVIQAEFAPIFGGAAFDAFGDLRAPLGQVDVRIYFFTGCAAAEAGTPTP